MKVFVILLAMIGLLDAYCRCRGGPGGSSVVCRRSINLPQAERRCEKATRMVILGEIQGGICNTVDMAGLLGKLSY